GPAVAASAEVSPAEAAEIAVGGALLAGRPAWPVRIAFRPRGADGAAAPVYAFSAVLADSGAARSVRYDYGGFVLAGRLVGMTLLEPRSC
ncbi:DUF1849 family protein, partial [Mycobacterium tuberculosis]|nr:DUF1849 family protein [Mycobacterium tuberculosis]